MACARLVLLVLAGVCAGREAAAQRTKKPTGKPVAEGCGCMVATNYGETREKTVLSGSSPSDRGALWESPINFEADAELPKPNSKIHTFFPNGVGATTMEKSNATYLYLDKRYGVTFRTSGNGYLYTFEELHFHYPSESTVANEVYDLEVHFVHRRILPINQAPAGYCECAKALGASYVFAPTPEDNIPGWTELKFGHIAVIGALFELGDESAFLGQFIKGDEIIREVPKFSFDLLPMDGLTALTFEGSLTTPPYTGKLAWNFLKTVYQLSPRQLSTYMKYNDHENIRGTRPLNRRPIGTAKVEQH